MIFNYIYDKFWIFSWFPLSATTAFRHFIFFISFVFSACVCAGFSCQGREKAIPLATLNLDLMGQAVDENGNILFAGNPLRIEDVEFEIAWLYMGFLSCPDMCPAALNRLSKASHLLGRKKNKVATIFLTIDPQRDTLDLLRTRLQSYGLAGAVLRDDVSKIDSLFLRLLGTRRNKDNLHSHSTRIFLMDKAGRVWENFPSHENEATIAKVTNQYLSWW